MNVPLVRIADRVSGDVAVTPHRNETCISWQRTTPHEALTLSMEHLSWAVRNGITRRKTNCVSYTWLKRIQSF